MQAKFVKHVLLFCVLYFLYFIPRYIKNKHRACCVGSVVKLCLNVSGIEKINYTELLVHSLRENWNTCDKCMRYSVLNHLDAKILDFCIKLIKSYDVGWKDNPAYAQTDRYYETSIRIPILRFVKQNPKKRDQNLSL